MPATPLSDVARRLLVNVDNEHGEFADAVMRLPTSVYTDPARYAREVEVIFRRLPLVTALSVDIPKPGDFRTLTIAGRPIVTVRGDDGVARSFVNACRHRGAQVVCDDAGSSRRFTCPYHAWVYDTSGALVGIPQRETFGEVGDTGLIALPTAERAGVVFTVLTPGAPLDIDEFLGDMGDALVHMELDRMHPYPVTTTLDSGNWKTTADGYLDGYHIGFLHRNNLGLKQINNRNAWDLYGPHVRFGFANKTLPACRDLPVDQWDLPDVMSLVHYLFPNVSISGQPGRATMVSIILPGDTVDTSTVHQTQYSRVPLDTPGQMEEMEQRRIAYTAITRDEDFATVIGINNGLPALAGTDFLFGRNESGNQNLHRWVDHYLDVAT
jgi:phenylpropionate dioxygenase-like ring-hydroxylating dioxygenase large terminal subunit